MCACSPLTSIVSLQTLIFARHLFQTMRGGYELSQRFAAVGGLKEVVGGLDGGVVEAQERAARQKAILRFGSLRESRVTPQRSMR